MFSVVRVCHSICPQGMPVHGPAHLCVGSWFRSHYKALPLCKGPSAPVKYVQFVEQEQKLTFGVILVITDDVNV